MNKEEIEELKEFTIDLTDIDELALGLEVCSKKSNMVIQEFAKLIIELEQQNQKYKEVIDKIKKEVDKIFVEGQIINRCLLLSIYENIWRILKEGVIMNKDEILEVMEYHFKKIKKLCQIYVDREIDYKTGINNSRLIEVCKLIEELKCESGRINELEKMLHDYDSKD